MRKNWKKLVSLVLTAACVMIATVAPVFAETESTPAYSPIPESTIDQMLSYSRNVVEKLTSYSDEELNNMASADIAFTVRSANAWLGTKEELGDLVELGEGETEKDGDFVTCTIPAKFSKNPGIVRVYWNVNTLEATDMTFTVENSKSVLLGQAGMNTVVGVGIVFSVLVFLIIVISAFDPIFGGGKKKAAPAPAKQETKPTAPAPAAAVQPAADDLELQAVIAAAIAMYEEDTASASGDAYVARPVRRKSNWKRA